MDQVTDLLQKWLENVIRLSMQNFILFSKEKNLSMSQIGALMFIHRQFECGISNIGEKLGISNAAASQMLDRLVKLGLISRQEDPKDRRGKILTLTRKGNQILQESIKIRQNWQNELMCLLDNEEKKKIKEALKILIQKTNDFLLSNKEK
ncbi:MAG: MarR family winged helix-turn-helix transcriptional regulator [Promethearchaeota archaeon]